MNRHPIQSLLLLLTFFLFQGCGSTETLNIHQSESGIDINENLSNWPADETLMHTSEAFRYYVMQDPEYLYIFVNFRSPNYSRAIENSGFTLYINESEKYRDSRGISYPTGAFNLLREDPAAFRDLTRENDWFSNRQNVQRLESLQEEIFEQVMVVERYEDSRDPQYGLVSFEQLEAQGMEIAAETDQRYYVLKYRIPLNGSAPFDLESGKTYWLGFAIEPPQFSYRDADNSGRFVSQRNRGIDSMSNRQASRMRQRMGLYSEWFKIQIQ